jgi:hypothetical protein
MNPPLKILLSHITRMHYPRICIAGIELQTSIHVRPITGKKDILDVDFLSQVALGAVVDLGWYAFRSTPPEIEDCFFKPSQAKCEQILSPEEFWQSLTDVSEKSLHDIFEDALTPSGSTFYILPNTGKASLGELHMERIQLTFNSHTQKVRVQGNTKNQAEFSLPVTDIRLYTVENNVFIPNVDTILWLQKQLKNTSVILSIGLSRAWSNDASISPRHWLQVNGIHLENNPLWQGVGS